ncbi:MAG TPA: VOC family protein [Roseiarcus sp.]|jgi:catechol 2,3-dioxygenase-like lactoylglutathione lyase family enzyme|nr:VOC family protein [Roseiarcus sp.]
MLDHIGLRTKKLDALVGFYETCLKPLGYAKLSAYDGGAGFGKNEVPSLWIGASKDGPSSVHLAFESPTRKAVDAFYKAAMEGGAKDNGKPGVRADYGASYYAAFVIDPDGNNIEAVCMKA